MEELAWLTDQMRAPTGGTQHRCLRPSPRTTIEMDSLESGANRRWMDYLLRGNSAGTWWAPVLIDMRQLAAGAAAAAEALSVDTAGARFIEGGHVLVIGEDPRIFEVCEIDSIASDTIGLADPLAYTWPAGTQVMPVRRARFADMPAIGRFTSDSSGLIDLRFRLEEDLDTPASIPGSTYRGLPVFDFAMPAWTTDPSWVPERQTSAVDDEIGVPVVADLAGVALGKTTMQYAPDTAADVLAFRGALFALAGRWSPAWVPSWTHDLQVVANVASSATTIDVGGPLLSAATLQANHRDIRIELFDGTVLYRRITDVAAHTSTVDRLTVDSALPAFSAGSVRMVCHLGLCTQGSDVNRLRYADATAMQCELVWEELDHEL